MTEWEGIVEAMRRSGWTLEMIDQAKKENREITPTLLAGSRGNIIPPQHEELFVTFMMNLLKKIRQDRPFADALLANAIAMDRSLQKGN